MMIESSGFLTAVKEIDRVTAWKLFFGIANKFFPGCIGEINATVTEVLLKLGGSVTTAEFAGAMFQIRNIFTSRSVVSGMSMGEAPVMTIATCSPNYEQVTLRIIITDQQALGDVVDLTVRATDGEKIVRGVMSLIEIMETAKGGKDE